MQGGLEDRVRTAQKRTTMLNRHDRPSVRFRFLSLFPRVLYTFGLISFLNFPFCFYYYYYYYFLPSSSL